MTESSGKSAEDEASRTSADLVAFRLLKGLDVRLGNRSVRLTTPQERTLLPLLMTAPGRVRPVTEIVAGLWSDDRPPRPEKTGADLPARSRSRAEINTAHLSMINKSPSARRCM